MADDQTNEHGETMPSESAVPWCARKVDGIWCVGMEGNLRFVEDATLRITGGWLTDDTAREVAESVAAQHNAAIGQVAPADASDVTIDAGGIADVTIEGTWQTLRLRASVETDPDDSSLTLLDEQGRASVTIQCDVLEKALPHLVRFGRTGMLHTVAGGEQDPSVAEAFKVAIEPYPDAVLHSDVDGHKGSYALSDGKVVQLYGETEMPFTGTADDIRAILADGACHVRPR